ncbi:hypothetical protein LBMAG33_3250 [Candidatus Levyibacteriota bacterium]|nr:hypothetical protein LBMAG33_3250 [Candidatus Levybacteria bacterium]
MNISKNTILLIAVLVVFTISLIILATSTKNQPAININIPNFPSPTKSHQEIIESYTLSLSPNPLIIQTKSKTPSIVNLNISTGNNLITSAEIRLTYDPKIISITNIEPGGFFINPSVVFNKNNVENGIIIYAIISREGKNKNGTIAKLTIQNISGKLGELSKIDISPESIITSSNSQSNLLKSAIGTSIKFINDKIITPTIPTFPTLDK